MRLSEIFLIALGLSMDAFAVAICLGLNMQKATIKKAFIIGLYFGIFQAAMPLIGYFAATLFADKIIDYDHWIAFILLLFLGGKMVIGSLRKGEAGLDNKKSSEKTCIDSDCSNNSVNNETSLKPSIMLPYAFATSIDALAVGVSFAFLKVEIFSAVSFVGIVTLILSMIGVKIGNMFGTKIKSKAELIGGLILILIGVKILIEHLR